MPLLLSKFANFSSIFLLHHRVFGVESLNSVTYRAALHPWHWILSLRMDMGWPKLPNVSVCLFIILKLQTKRLWKNRNISSTRFFIILPNLRYTFFTLKISSILGQFLVNFQNLTSFFSMCEKGFRIVEEYCCSCFGKETVLILLKLTFYHEE